MPWHSEHKTQSKDKILDCAASLFANFGFDGVSIDQIMEEAGLTRGAFYAHFKSKEDVYSQGIVRAAQCAKEHMEAQSTQNPKAAAKFYLEIGMRQEEDADYRNGEAGRDYCPLSSLISDIAHQKPAVKHSYTRLLKGFQSYYEEKGLSQGKAIQVTTQLIGALALSRTVTDERLKLALLQNAADAVEQLIDFDV